LNPEQPRGVAGQPASILVVDDTAANLQVLAGMLKDRGYKVRPVPSGKLALLAARRDPPDLILLDINMPEMNGFEVCQHLKADGTLNKVPVIFISALTETLDKVKAFAVGGVDYLTKPFQMEELQARVETHLTLRRLQLELEETNSRLERANDRLELLAVTDGLTGLKNHRAFQEKLAEEIRRVVRHPASLSLLFLDVDRFKQFNDTFGHAAGDGVLQSVARLLQEVSRSTDFVARYGGEEFVILMPNTNLEGSLVIAERIRKCVEQGYWRERPITVSIGVTTMDNANGDGMVLINQADAAMYHSKTNGRNCVHHAGRLDQSACPAALLVPA
jgi:diguanylate cyclase (GGDEF)-like protein